MRSLPELRIFCPCFLENRKLGVGVLPECEEILVGALRLHSVARERERSCQLQARQRGHWIHQHDGRVVDNPLKLGGGRPGLVRGEIRLTANVDGIEPAEIRAEAEGTYGLTESRG